MAEIQDLLPLFKGLQLTAKASAQSDEEYSRHLSVNSTVREVITNNVKIAEQFIQKISSDEFENVTNVLKKTVKCSALAEASSGSYKAAEDYSHYKLNDLEDYISKNADQSLPKSSSIIDPEKLFSDDKYISEWYDFIEHYKTNQNESASVAVELSSVARQRELPASSFKRMTTIIGLSVQVVSGTVTELAKGAVGMGGSTNLREALLCGKNIENIVNTLCQARGAALKLAQKISMEDSTIIPPELSEAFKRARETADYMPDEETFKILEKELGSDWRSKFESFTEKPFAAASIGQVHQVVLPSGSKAAIKIQYKGVAESIDSDISNVVRIFKMLNIDPSGVFLNHIVKVAKEELSWEVDYKREAESTKIYGELITAHKEYRVPKVFEELTTHRVLTTEFMPGVSLDKCFDLDYEDRKIIGSSMLRLYFLELFEFKCIQSDPNWSNFLYDIKTRTLGLIDFGATRFFSDDFINDHRALLCAAVEGENDKVLDLSQKMKFLTGDENEEMKKSHVNAVMILGEMFRCDEFDFGQQDVMKRLAPMTKDMNAMRQCPPPEEIYSIHRKMLGVFSLCAHLDIKMDCRPIYENIVKKPHY